ncbi:MAG: 50S ribosomal protein L31e [Candidatus Thermoplasmatota archaeon]|jgi:large subunit ribosomal protein L31e|uniref:50S ribosomal protein L31e n=1 Tax=Ferroplasma sp. TaxID=2591003 RepID=UPI0026219459|nr:50S ribosomal protein L31e [Ferroplasma sp.]MCL4311140.1 50S ribosomal protein L31e [Candidatus Thermoplasmatota archaeon]
MVENNELSTEELITVSLRGARSSSRRRRADTAISIIKDAVSKYTKSEKNMIWIDNKVNELIWDRGREHIPTKISLKIIKLEDGTTEIILP